MDVTIRTNSGAPLVTPWSARGMSDGKYAALAAADSKKQTILSVASQAFAASPMKGAESSKAHIKEQIQGIIKRLTILKKLFAGNPKEMARALAQVFKELKGLVKAYKAAVEKEVGASASAVDGLMPADTAVPPTADSSDANAGATPAAPQDDQPQAASGDDKTALYNQAVQQVQKQAGEDGLDFSKQLKDLVNEIEDKMLAPARTQRKAQKSDKATDDAFKDAEDSLKDLRKAMDDMDRDIKRDVPSAGQTLDIAA